ncbi:MAG: galactose mutarotase [Christensenellaceae bacterium]|jgi:aldose 1-epimerase|nr:galactose mutarotase [Christensenellaceae bacterium]
MDKLFLRNDKIKVALCAYGARIVSISVPDKNGKPTEVVLGYDSVEDYSKKGIYFGATVGRVANRIANASFVLDGKTYRLDKNNGSNCLHGGNDGLSNKTFIAKEQSETAVTFEYISKNGESGFPGELVIRVGYKLVGGGVVIEYSAHTDSPTLCALTNHTYFNLDGSFFAPVSVYDTLLKINADSILSINENFIPCVKMNVADTPFDFREFKKIGAQINDGHLQLKIAGGYDHNFCLNKAGLSEAAATAYSEKTGILMRVFTDKPGVQLYTGNFLGDGTAPFPYRSGFCLETQSFPNACNNAELGNVRLDPQGEYCSRTVYEFSVVI